MTVIRMVFATVFPALVALGLTALDKKEKYRKLDPMLKQVIAGVVFGICSILATQVGIPLTEGVVMNVRDANPLCAGLIFGGPAGFIAGVMGGVYRWLCVYWGGASYTRIACSAATILAGFFADVMRVRLYDNKKPHFLIGLSIGMTMEVLHMLLILVTNLGDISHAFIYVRQCSTPMIVCNGLAVMAAIIATGIVKEDESIEIRSHRLSYDFGFWLLVCMLAAFVVTSASVYQFTERLEVSDAALFRSVTLYLVIFMQILTFTALFILINQMLKRKVAASLNQINKGLESITEGNLDTVINVRTHKEFADLSDDVNATVDTLKHYIKAAEERYDKELELARQIQRSALPSVFPPFPDRTDFALYASMDAAKEVGGDFYDFYLVGEENLLFLIADVSGKGIPAALFMMRAKTLIKSLVESGRSVEEVFEIANQKLCEGNDADMFITAWLGRLNLKTGLVTFANAGHNPPLLIRKGEHKASYVRSKANFVLAGMDTTVYTKQELTLHPGDSIFLYTDGVTEAVNMENELYGEERLEKMLSSVGEAFPETACNAVKNDILRFAKGAPQADDITMLMIHFSGNPVS